MKFEEAMYKAVHSKENVKLSNTEVRYDPELGLSDVFLFGDHIGCYVHHTAKFIVNKGTFKAHPTKTTVARLRALGVDAMIRNVPLIKGIPI